jgi:hypothetical protein
MNFVGNRAWLVGYYNLNSSTFLLIPENTNVLAIAYGLALKAIMVFVQ